MEGTCINCDHSIEAHAKKPCDALNLYVQPNTPCACMEFIRADPGCTIHGEKKTIGVLPRPGQTAQQAYEAWCVAAGIHCSCRRKT